MLPMKYLVLHFVLEYLVKLRCCPPKFSLINPMVGQEIGLYVCLDIFHTMQSVIKPFLTGHGPYFFYLHRLRDALLVVFKADLEGVEEVPRQSGMTQEQIAIKTRKY